jgi:hypothetical protein
LGPNNAYFFQLTKELADVLARLPVDGPIPSPFQQYRPHELCPGILAPGTPPGILDVPSSSSLFKYCQSLCRNGGSWITSPSPVAGFQLVHVQAVLHEDAGYICYKGRQNKMTNLRAVGGDHFNFSTKSLDDTQKYVLAALREQFQERSPHTSAKAVNTFYSYHGPRREHLESICMNGMVATRSMDAGYFGCGCYSTLNIEYAIRYSRGDFDFVEDDGVINPKLARRRSVHRDGRFPVVMFATSVSMAYPITPRTDYGHTQGTPPHCSDYFGRPLKPGFDCHVICVAESSNFQATTREDCQYVEVVIEQESQMLPIAVLWFEEV